MSQPYTVFIPSAKGAAQPLGIAPRSAIVAANRGEEDRAIVYYEGNLFGAANLKRYTERLSVAAGRASKRYPTVAMMALTTDLLTPVGTYDLATHTFVPTDLPALQAWLDGEVLA